MVQGHAQHAKISSSRGQAESIRYFGTASFDIIVMFIYYKRNTIVLKYIILWKHHVSLL